MKKPIIKVQIYRETERHPELVAENDLFFEDNPMYAVPIIKFKPKSLFKRLMQIFEPQEIGLIMNIIDVTEDYYPELSRDKINKKEIDK